MISNKNDLSLRIKKLKEKCDFLGCDDLKEILINTSTEFLKFYKYAGDIELNKELNHLLIVLIAGTYEQGFTLLYNKYLAIISLRPEINEIFCKNFIIGDEESVNPSSKNLFNRLEKVCDKNNLEIFKKNLSKSVLLQLDALVKNRNNIAHNGEIIKTISSSIVETIETFFSVCDFFIKLDNFLLSGTIEFMTK